MGTSAQDTIVVRPRRVPDARRMLVCLGFCGGGAGAYVPWTDSMPHRTELAAICYPGREGRMLEDFARDWDELAEDAVSAVLSATTAGCPYVLFGHSMGGWMAFDVAVRIEERGGPAPESLVVSAANAPSSGATARSMSPAKEDSDEQLMDWIGNFGLMAEHVRTSPDLREMALELMRADIRVCDSFFYREGAAVLVPLQVLTGASDPIIDRNSGEQWRKIAKGGFRHDVLPGGHFYTPEVWNALPAYMTALGDGPWPR